MLLFRLNWLISKSDPIKIEQNDGITFKCALYYLPSPVYDSADLLVLVENTVLRMHLDYPDWHMILAGDNDQD